MLFPEQKMCHFKTRRLEQQADSCPEEPSKRCGIAESPWSKVLRSQVTSGAGPSPRCPSQHHDGRPAPHTQTCFSQKRPSRSRARAWLIPQLPRLKGDPNTLRAPGWWPEPSGEEEPSVAQKQGRGGLLRGGVRRDSARSSGSGLRRKGSAEPLLSARGPSRALEKSGRA